MSAGQVFFRIGCVAMGLSLLAGCAVTGTTQRQVPHQPTGRLADMQIYDRTANETLPVYMHKGKAYVVGTPGHEYRIDITNRTNSAILGVISVDGLNTSTGETANPSQDGKIFNAGREYSVTGWDKSETQIAAFYFTSISDSYAGRVGRPNNVGVIGMAVFKEKQPEPALQRENAPARMAPAPSAADGSFSLGTGHGRLETVVRGYQRFERASKRPAEVITIYYDSYDNLVARGIISQKRSTSDMPQAFPGQNRRFVPDPPK